MKKVIVLFFLILPCIGKGQNFGRVFVSLDSALVDPSRVQTLRLDSYDIVEVNSEIVKLTDLRSISLAHNIRLNLPDLFDKLSQLPKLEYLNLSDCQIEFLPSDISKLSNLKYLIIGGNKLTRLPSEITRLRKLKELSFSQYPDDFRGLSDEQKFQMLKQLPRTKILLTESFGGQHGHYRLGSRTVRVTKNNLWPNK